MKLSLSYLQERHQFWKNEIGRLKIWNPDEFKDIEIRIRPKSKCYNGLFSRRISVKGGKKTIADKISIYKNSEEFDPVFLDSILVHEMIHQYVCQAKLKDTSTHGKIFKKMMTQINENFPKQLKINIRDHNPKVPLKGEGLRVHRLVISWNEKECYCCVINPSKIVEFHRILTDYKKRGVVKDFHWAVSNDLHFDRYVRCTRTLHGFKMPLKNMEEFCREYNVVKVNL